MTTGRAGAPLVRRLDARDLDAVADVWNATFVREHPLGPRAWRTYQRAEATLSSGA